MSKNRRILNLTRGFHLKLSAAERAVEACSAEWVEPGVSIRSLTLAESIMARNIQAATREPLPYAELFGLKFEPSPNGIEATKREATLIREAITFVLQA